MRLWTGRNKTFCMVEYDAKLKQYLFDGFEGELVNLQGMQGCLSEEKSIILSRQRFLGLITSISDT